MLDLHSHTNRSDGTYTPAELVDYACEKGLKVLAITDHDTVEGIPEAVEHAAALRAEGRTDVPEIVPGIEFSTVWRNGDVHVVGLNVDYTDQAFCAKLQGFIDSREGRNREMAKKLKSVGIGISYEGMLQLFPDCVLTRAHFARYLMEYGYVKSVKEAFERYLGPGCPCYVPREKVTPVQAVEMTLQAGGIPILAHPMIYRLSEKDLGTLIEEMKEAGLIGIEALYCTHSDADERFVRTMASRYGLTISGGSDFHGANKPGLDLGIGYGGLNVPDYIWEDLKKTKAKSLQ